MRRAQLKASLATTFNFANPTSTATEHTTAHDVLARAMDIVSGWNDGIPSGGSHHLPVAWCASANESNEFKLNVNFLDAGPAPSGR